jgi:hypothetical protein
MGRDDPHRIRSTTSGHRLLVIICTWSPEDHPAFYQGHDGRPDDPSWSLSARAIRRSAAGLQSTLGLADWVGMDASQAQTPVSPAAPSRRRWLVVLATVVLVAGVASITYSSRQRDDANDALLNDLFKPASPPPARMMVCEGAMDATCAGAAAERVAIAFAWVDEPMGYELAWVIASRNPGNPDGTAIASQYLVGADGQGFMEVVTSVPPIPGEFPSPPSRSVSNGIDTATVWEDDELGVIQLEWTHDGVEYVLTAQPRPWDPSAVIEVWKTIQYTTPRPA